MRKLMRQRYVLAGIFAVVLFIIILGVILASASGKPRDYEDKVKTSVKALYSESKMEKALKDVIDIKGAVAWQEANHNAKDFNKEYKKVKSSDDDVDEMKEALMEYAVDNERYYGSNYSKNEVTLKKIKAPKKSKENGKIYTVDAEWDGTNLTFVFYKGKIIDIQETDDNESYFEYFLELYNL